MKKKFRWPIILLEHILITVAVVSILAVCILPSMKEEILTGVKKEQYEDSIDFSSYMNGITNEIIWGIGARDILEVDGEYNPDILVDLAEYQHQGMIVGENESGLAVRLGDLVKFDGIDDTSEDYRTHEIIVCKKTDGTYEYFYYPEFEAKLFSGSLKIIWNSEISSRADGSELQHLIDVGTFPEGFSGLENDKKELEYIDCWRYDAEQFPHNITLDGGKDILQVLNTDERWNGKLSQAADLFWYVCGNLRSNYEQWQNAEAQVREGNSNFYYIFANKETGTVYSNRQGYEKYKLLDVSLDKIKALGKYMVIESELEGFESNIDGVRADEWMQMIRDCIGAEDYVFAVGVDTAYPVQDGFYQGFQGYKVYDVSARAILALGVVSAILWILGIIWLTRNEEAALKRFDCVKTELAAAVVVAPWLGCMALIYFLAVEGIRYEFAAQYAEELCVCAALATVITCAFFLWGYLSLVRRIKEKTLWKNSILCSVYKRIKMLLENRASIWKISLEFVIFLGIQILLIGIGDDSFAVWIFIILLECVIFAYLAYEAIGKAKLEKGIARIAGGEINYKIPLSGLTEGQRKTAEMINSIGSGLEVALEESMRSERMKTDLITNVSHDIKTPLTSIINYIDLLKKENFTDSKIQRYLEILDAKAQRLKTLTEDVVEASKVSSGNISIELMNINFVEILQQVSGEFEEKFKTRGLKEILLVPEKEVIVRVDGRRMYRVLENIYNNVAKYAMENSRVYAELKRTDDGMIFSLKNISEQPLNISADELTERFIRGDVSRSTEGSGLGLSIAKNLTELQGGKFEVLVDGDLFKVMIEF